MGEVLQWPSWASSQVESCRRGGQQLYDRPTTEALPSRKFWRRYCLVKRKRKPVEVLTVGRVRHITAPSSWRPASAGNGCQVKLPAYPANMGLSGQNGI